MRLPARLLRINALHPMMWTGKPAICAVMRCVQAYSKSTRVIEVIKLAQN